MAFVKLLLILAALSFARNTVRPKVRATYTKGNIYYSNLDIDKDGVITFDLKNSSTVTDPEDLVEVLSKKIEDYKPIDKNTKETDEKFNAVAATEAAFDALLTSKELTDAEKACAIIPELHEQDYYGILGYTAKAVEGADIATSITHLFKNGPTKVTYKNIPAGFETVYVDVPLLSSCTVYNIFALSAPLKAGIVDTKCVPNTAIPSDGSKCTTDAATYKAYLKGYRQGSFTGDATTVKQLLIRFGAVEIGRNTVIGWEKVGDVENWIYAVPTYIGDDEDDLAYGYGWYPEPLVAKTYEGFVYFNGVSAIRAAFGLIAAVLVLPALLL